MTNRALPTKQRMNRFDSGDSITIGLSADMGIRPRKNPLIAIDNGSYWEKVGRLVTLGEGTGILVQKVLNLIAEQERGKSRVNSRANSPVKGNLEITYRGKTYTTDMKGASMGGISGLHGDKMEKLTLRVLFALTLLGLGNGEEVDLSVTTFFTPGNFKAQENSALKQLERDLVWSTPQGRKSAKIKSIQIYPEGYHLGFYRPLATPETPGLTNVWSARYDIGYRTLLVVLVDPYGNFDDERSISFDGKGTSLFYQWVAQEAGIDNPEDPQFIQAVNAGAATYRPQGFFKDIPLADSIETARGWYIDELADIIRDYTPPEVESSCIGGGGALTFGADLLPELRGTDKYVVDQADIANVATQVVRMTQELQLKGL